MGLIQHTGQLPQVGLQRSNRLTHFCQLYVAPGRHNPDVERAERPLRQELNQSVRLQGSRQVHAADQRHAQAFLAHLLDKNLVVAGAMQLHFKKKQSNGFASFLIADSAYSASATARFYLKFRPLVRWCAGADQVVKGAKVLQTSCKTTARWWPDPQPSRSTQSRTRFWGAWTPTSGFRTKIAPTVMGPHPRCPFSVAKRRSRRCDQSPENSCRCAVQACR